MSNTIQEQPIAKKFLDAIGRNSNKSKTTYAVALSHFQNFLDTKNGLKLDSVVAKLVTNELNVYDVLDEFVTYIISIKNGNDSNGTISENSIKAYMAAIRSYLQYNKIDIIPYRFKHEVKMPKVMREDEEAVDAADVREIILHTNNRRLKPYELGLASGGMRTIELASLRLCDFNDSVNPTQITIRRKKYTKTKQARYTFISDEATKFIREWIAWKYRPRSRRQYDKVRKDTDLIFATDSKTTPQSIYEKMRVEFSRVLDSINMGSRKDNAQRHKITLNSFRRFAKTTVGDAVNSDYSEWFIGHSKSSYWAKKPADKAKIYKNKCMKCLTFLDYTLLEATGKNIETKLDQKDKEISNLRQELYETDEGLRGQLSEKDIIMQKAIAGIDLLMKQRDEDSKRIQELEGLIAKVLPMGKQIHDIKEKVDGVKSTLKEIARVK